LDPTPEQFDSLAGDIVSRLATFLADRETAPAADFADLEPLYKEIRQPPPEEGQRSARILDLAFAAGVKGHDTAGPGWLAYIPGGGLPTAALADLIARTTNRFVTIWEAGPVMADIEATVVRWFCDLFGYGSQARGILTTGGSMANFSALVTARHTKLGEDFQSGTIYLTSEAHGSIAKAAALAGFPRAALRLVPLTRQLRMDARALKALVAADRRAGLRPLAVVASAGTTNTGAIDDIEELASVAQQEELWLHVDGAYGGFFQLTDRGKTAFAGIGLADSITLDPHKGMFLPYGTGALVVRDGQTLRAAHEMHGPYLQDLAPEAEIPNFADYSAELSRDARGLRVWLPVQLHGLAAFRLALDEKLDLARVAAARLREIEGIEVPWDPELSIVAFRAGSDAASMELLKRINATRRVVLSSTVVEGRFTLRIAVLSFRTHGDRIDELLELIASAARGLQV
jgi:aromatic-L-amino-acid/L-tryptophan decarboxylase